MATSSLPPTPGKACRLRGQSRQRALNKPLVCATIVAGIAAWLAGSAIYPHLADTLPRPVLIGLLFGLLCALTTTAIMMVGRKMVTFEANLLSRKGSRRGAVGLLLLGGILLTLLAMLFEWVYEIEATTEQHDPTSYVFVVDDSGSMEGNDPNRSRFAAIPTVLGEADDAFPFMVYRFSNEVGILRDMAPASDGIPPLAGSQEGGTSLKAALNAVLDDRAAGRWEGGAYPEGDPPFRRRPYRHVFLRHAELGNAALRACRHQRVHGGTGRRRRCPHAAHRPRNRRRLRQIARCRGLGTGHVVGSHPKRRPRPAVGPVRHRLRRLVRRSQSAVPVPLGRGDGRAVRPSVRVVRLGSTHPCHVCRPIPDRRRGHGSGRGSLRPAGRASRLALWVLMATTIALVPTFAARIRQRGTQRPLWGDLPLLSVRR